MNASCSNRIPNIKVPTLFIAANDDPILGVKMIDYDGIKDNKNTIIGTTEHGGHLGYVESSIFGDD